jgi:hypothetical protein
MSGGSESRVRHLQCRSHPVRLAAWRLTGLSRCSRLTMARPDGTVGVDAAKLAARHDAKVQLSMASGPVAVIVLGGSHDLSASVRKLGSETTEFVRVTTRRFRKLAGD